MSGLRLWSVSPSAPPDTVARTRPSQRQSELGFGIAGIIQTARDEGTKTDQLLMVHRGQPK